MPSSAIYVALLALTSSLTLAIPGGTNDRAKFCLKHYSTCGFKNIGQCVSNAAYNGSSFACCPPGQQVDKHKGQCYHSSTGSSTQSYTHSSPLSSTRSSTLFYSTTAPTSSQTQSSPTRTTSQTQSSPTRTTYTSPTMTATVVSSCVGYPTPSGTSGSGNGGSGNSGGSGNGGNNNLPQLIFPATCSSGSPYCCNGDSCENMHNSNVSCNSGSVTCCNSNAGLISVNVAICGNSVNIPITIDALNGLTL